MSEPRDAPGESDHPMDSEQGEAAASAGRRPRTPLLAGVIAVAAVLGSVTYTILGTVRSGAALEYYLDVDEALRATTRLEGQVLRLHGNVVARTIQKKPGELDYRFALFRRGRWLEVTYRGLLPDAFKDCAEVVVTGRLVGRARHGQRTETLPRADVHTLRATKVTAKCPSKYEDQRLERGNCGDELQPLVVAARRRARGDER